jgi:hypothetical protein
VDTPVLAWRARDVFAEDADEQTIKIPEFASLLAQSIAGAGESGETVAPPEPAEASVDPPPASTRTPPDGVAWVQHLSRTRLVGAAALAIAWAATMMIFVRGLLGAPGSEISRESTAIARSVVGCPALPQAILTRASSASPTLTPKQSVRNVVAHAPPHAAPAPRVAVRAAPPRVAPRPGIIRKTPF